MAINCFTADSHKLSAHRTFCRALRPRFSRCNAGSKPDVRIENGLLLTQVRHSGHFGRGGPNQGSFFSSNKEESWHRFSSKVENLFPAQRKTPFFSERILGDLTGIKSFLCWAFGLLWRGPGCRYPQVFVKSLRLKRFTCLQPGLLDYARGNSKSLSEG